MTAENDRDVEVTVQGHEDYVRGFVRGLLVGEHSRWWPVFHQDFGIEDESLGETLKEWVGLSEPLSRFIVPEAALPLIRDAVADPRSVGIELRSARPIEGASFPFTFAVFSAEMGAQVRDIFTKVPPSVVVEGFDPVERVDPDANGTELYSPAHEYQLKGKGLVRGPFRDVLYVHEQARRQDQIKERRLALDLGAPID